LITSVAASAEVHVMVSASYYPVYAALAPAFERQTGHRLVKTRGPSLGDSPEVIPNRLRRDKPNDLVS